MRGNIAGGEVNYAWSNLTAMANSAPDDDEPRATPPTSTRALDYRGIKMSDILEASGAREVRGPGGSEVTVVAADGFLHTLPIADVKRFPMHARDRGERRPAGAEHGRPAARDRPAHQSSRDEGRSTPRAARYYVTHLIVGTEPVALSVGGKTLHASELDATPAAHVVEGRVGFRFRWPNTPVKIHRVLVRDLVYAARRAIISRRRRESACWCAANLAQTRRSAK